MIITPDVTLLDSLPTDPALEAHICYVKGTPYVHIMIPVEPRK